MLRFGTPIAESRRRSPTRERWRLWMLFAMACLVLWSIRFLQKPETAERLDSLFVATQQEEVTSSEEDKEIAVAEEVIIEPPAEVSFAGNKLVADDSAEGDQNLDLSVIKDNTYFRAEENPVWFSLLDRLQKTALSGDSVGEVTYAQLLEQPDVYRGEVVTVRGTAMREELLDAPANDLGIERYHRLVIRPEGGGVWPMVVYSLELPAKFPRGENPKVEVTAHGFFFKNWSYSWQDGLGLAPVILTKTVDWQPPVVATPTRKPITTGELLGMIAGGGLLASLLGWFAWRQSRRPATVLGHDIVISLPPSAEGER